MAQYCMVTSAGMNAVHNNVAGTIIDIRYFLPMYDYRIDESLNVVDTTFDNSEISSVTNVTDTVPFGEPIFYYPTTFYSLSNEDTNLVSAAYTGATDWEVDSDNYKYKNKARINLYNGEPLQVYLSGTSADSPSPDNNEVWTFYNGALTTCASLPTNLTNPDRTYLYSNVAYAAVTDDSGDTAGQWKCNFNDSIGTLKFNKVALYGVMRNSSGNEIGSPFLFGQMIMPEPIIKTNAGQGGVSTITSTFQLNFSSTGGESVSNLFFSTSSDYWLRENDTFAAAADYGLRYEGNVYIDREFSSDDKGQAKLFAGTHYTTSSGPSSAAERNRPQLVLQKENADEEKLRAYFRVTEDRNLEFDFCTCAASNPLSVDAIYPGRQADENQGVDLGFIGTDSEGQKANRFRTIYLGSKREDSFYDVGGINIHGSFDRSPIGEIMIGATGTQDEAMRIQRRYIKLRNGVGIDGASDFYNCRIEGADIYKGTESIDKSLGIYTYTTTAVSDEANATQINIVPAISAYDSPTLDTIIRDRDYSNTTLNENGVINLITKSGINVATGIIMKAASPALKLFNADSPIVASRYIVANPGGSHLTLAGGIFDDDENQAIIAGVGYWINELLTTTGQTAGLTTWVADTTFTGTVNSLSEVDKSMVTSTGTTTLEDDSTINLIAHDINLHGDIIPLAHRAFDIGSADRRIKNLYVQNIQAWGFVNIASRVNLADSLYLNYVADNNYNIKIDSDEIIMRSANASFKMNPDGVNKFTINSNGNLTTNGSISTSSLILATSYIKSLSRFDSPIGQYYEGNREQGQGVWDNTYYTGTTYFDGTGATSTARTGFTIKQWFTEFWQPVNDGDSDHSILTNFSYMLIGKTIFIKFWIRIVAKPGTITLEDGEYVNIGVIDLNELAGSLFENGTTVDIIDANNMHQPTKAVGVDVAPMFRIQTVIGDTWNGLTSSEFVQIGSGNNLIRIGFWHENSIGFSTGDHFDVPIDIVGKIA